MASASRYEIVDTLATGEFATVFRARDRELSREVAIKQIHDQYLADPRQLTRYWQEAQLLASLQHPNILTVYDIVRSRGWLILELMRGSLKPAAEGQPLDVDYLRVVLVNCLSGLHFLHSNGVIHGDIKPSNILVGLQKRVKLGDFGLARRASNQEGSLLKGTTKYMAPELLSTQFGPIGPPSDLYSLGFSAYEMLCGDQFESLLPTLSNFGRNKQMAWMLWHSTADVRLPEIHRVLEGVPDDLAGVIQRLIAKDMTKRYASAAEALRDLPTGSGVSISLPPPPDPEAEVAAEAETRRKQRLKYLATLAGTLLLAVCLAIALVPKRHKAAPAPPPGPERGVIYQIYANEDRFAIRRNEDGKAAEVLVKRFDRIFINGESHLIQELEINDAVTIDTIIDPKTNRAVKEIHAFRPKTNRGRIHSITPDEASLVLTIEDPDQQGVDLTVKVPGDLKILVNGQSEIDGKPVRLADLRPGDRATVRHVAEESGRRADEVAIRRVVGLEGVLADDFDPRAGLLSINVAGQIVKFPFAQQYVITINGQPATKPTSLKKDDRVAIRRDTEIVEVKAQRTLDAAGVIQQIRYEQPQTLSVLNDKSLKVIYLVGPHCALTLGGEPITVEDLRPGDNVRVSHGAIGATGHDAIEAAAIMATRPPDPTRWAILVGMQDYDDKSLAPLMFSKADVKLFADALTNRYQVPADQVLSLTDENLVRLEQAIPERLKALTPEAKLVVFYTGHAHRDTDGTVYLAPKNFDRQRPSVTGMPLQDLADQLEACPAKEKLLLLDGSHVAATDSSAEEPSSSEMVLSLKLQPNRVRFRTVTAIASCKAGERGLDWPSNGHGLFAWCLADAFAGRADSNHDNRLETTELFAYLQKAMGDACHDLHGTQSPELFLPNDAPPRLSDDARKSLRRLAVFLGQSKVDADEAGHEYSIAKRLAGKEVEPRLLYGLLLIKIKDRENAQKVLEELKSEQPGLVLPMQGLAWLRFDKRSFPAGLNELTLLVEKLPKPKKLGEAYSAEAKKVLDWAGRLRSYAAEMSQESPRLVAEPLARLDAAVGALPAEAQEAFQQGREASEAVAGDFDKRIAASDDEATAKLLKVDRRQLTHYCEFPIDKFVQQILSQIDE
jgi:serine/threonine-protein kinase